MTLLTILLQQQGQGAGWSSIIMMVALVAIFYFFMIRPQTKRQKEIRKFREALKRWRQSRYRRRNLWKD